MEMDTRRTEGTRLLTRIWMECFVVGKRTGVWPTSIALCRRDIERVLIASANHEWEFRVTDKIFGIPLHLVEELPEGVIVVS